MPTSTRPRSARPYRRIPALLTSLLLPALVLATPPERVVSVDGSLTEIVYALGEADRLVAVDTTSTYPPEALASLPNVGYMRQLSAEPILSLSPDLVLSSSDAGPPAALQQLREAGVPVTGIENDTTAQGVLDKIRAVGEALSVSDAAAALAERVEAAFAEARADVARYDDRPRVLCLLSARGSPVAAGEDTAAAHLIALAGGRNAVTGYSGYKPLNPEAAVALRPDVILLADRTLKDLGGRETLLARPELAATPAGQAGRVVSMDMMLMLGFGPRTPEAVRRVAAAIRGGSEAAQAAP
ncbi:heme/hemin ABC transporter substrate-binding protein [Algiphilus sp.]|uniref:heme/hemin ABC transporter substrate-binding protein n=1 Tax=Algiphilus sp. TaxID=1872431 RepID=UPI003C3895DB